MVSATIQLVLIYYQIASPKLSNAGALILRIRTGLGVYCIMGAIRHVKEYDGNSSHLFRPL